MYVFDTNLVDVSIAGLLVVAVLSCGESIVRPVGVIVCELFWCCPRIRRINEGCRGAVHLHDQLRFARQFTLVLSVFKDIHTSHRQLRRP